MNHQCLRVSAAMSALALAVSAGLAGPFAAGNIAVLQIGDGQAALSNAGTAVFLLEINPTTGAVVQTIALPTVDSGTDHALVVSGTSTASGHMALSMDARFLTLAGIDAPVGTAAVSGTASATNPRVIARVNTQGVIDSSTALADSFSGNDIRSAVTTDGQDLWSAGTGSSGGSAGVRYCRLGDATSLQLSSTPTNTRVVDVFFGQLYVSSMSLSFRGINLMGAGIPNTGGQTTALLPGFDPSTTAPESAYGFFFSDADTLYIADDRALPNGGVQKWTFDGAAWTLQYTINSGLGAGCRGLTGSVAGGVVTLLATTGEAVSTPNHVVVVQDQGAASAFSTLVTAVPNTVLRGIAFAPAAGGEPICYANCDGSTAVPFLNVNDFVCFQTRFAAGDSYANCDGSTTPPILNVNDFICFQGSFAAGCSAP